MTAIGIDFGTTNSIMSVAYKEGNRLKTQPFYDKETKLPHPSIVWFKGSEIIVGSEAKKHINTYLDLPGNKFISSIKSKLGDSLIYNIFGQDYYPYQIATEILKYLRNYALREYKTFIEKDVDECVITIPITFTGKDRKALRKAANAAGIYIKTFVHEPFAAVLWYLNSQNLIKKDTTKNFLVFDWGGGTLDITLVRYENGRLYELNNSGIKDKAGDYFDSKIENFSISEFANVNSLNMSSIVISKPNRDRLKYVAEKEKIELSTSINTDVLLSSFYNDIDLNVHITRNEFEKLIAKEIDEAYSALINTVENSDYSTSEIETVLMIGGTSLIPSIFNNVIKKYGSKVVHLKNANSVISEGASIISYYDFKPYLVNPIKIKLFDDSDYIVFEKNMILNNNSKSIKFFCTDNRDGEARLIIMEGAETKKVINIEVNSELPKPYNHERINTEFKIDEDLILNIAAKGATKEKTNADTVHELRYGLMLGDIDGKI